MKKLLIAAAGAAVIALRTATASDNECARRSTMENVDETLTEVNTIHEFVVMEPRELKEMPTAIQALCDRKSVVLNLTMMEPHQAQRAVDFLTGGTYSILGHQQRIGERIFLFTPSCVQVRLHAHSAQLLG